MERLWRVKTSNEVFYIIGTWQAVIEMCDEVPSVMVSYGSGQ